MRLTVDAFSLASSFSNCVHTRSCVSLSGGDDDAHGNQTVLEAALNTIDVDWEISRYSGVVHGFTVWDSEDAYSLRADTRSWDSMLSVFDELLDGPYLVAETGESPDEDEDAASSSDAVLLLVLQTPLTIAACLVASSFMLL